MATAESIPIGPTMCGVVFTGCIGVTQHNGQNRLLAIGKRYGAVIPTHYRVSIESRLYGYINTFSRWKNERVSVVSFSEYDGQQLAMLLLSGIGEFVSAAGVWHVSNSGRGELLELRTDREHLA